MSLTPSNMLALNSPLPSFHLPDAQGRMVSSDDYAEQPLLVVFMCNHCPFVKHLAGALADFARQYQDRGLAVVGINSNDFLANPEDRPERMLEEARERGYTFPYLVDETQDVARAFDAACTPDFFLFDRHHKLAYRGQFDDSRPSQDIPVTGRDLRAAADAVLAGQSPDETQKPSMGCNIKWK
ncbi:thioredoxin family protein [Halomonas elongata]|uniref:AhpC domain protein n=1 Tax=Halomonas elongata (strain ATCC 33173 / DSM 2581 / NBRC 15536 / NCIMB 2198 / 1H9) TaxID=768066 RepID=E1VAJ1_HALED|nr:thioredoxin family protein [Halomonas elongata]WBF19307.1 thioredoxin family protein [Halomonas elongata]WPU48167.1 thioredoxin family protein [Halomonas elongata DSM 2581]CBV42037.1 AhpC domain protein [Halomonas elongata DSM 2581]